MRENFRSFEPTWKMWIAVNTRPHVRGTDTAIWERLKEVQFPVQFRDADDPLPENQARPVKDPALEQKLVAELPGILRWAVRGCLEWQKRGLGEPLEVREAVAEYRAQEDRLSHFLAEKPITARVRLKELFRLWKQHCEELGEQPGVQSELTDALRAKGYKVKRASGVYWVYPLEVGLPGMNGNATSEPDDTEPPTGSTFTWGRDTEADGFADDSAADE